MSEDFKTNTQAAIEAGSGLGAQVGRIVLERPGAAYVIEDRDRYHVKKIDLSTARPERAAGTRQLNSPESFAAFISRYATAESIVYADIEAREFTCVLNDHTAENPAHRDFRAVFKCPFAPEWEAWRKLHGKRTEQIDFLEHLEDRLPDITSHDGADILELVRDLEGSKEGSFRSGVNLGNGSVQVQFSEETSLSSKTGKVEFPQAIDIAVQMFYGADIESLNIRLRYRISSGNLVFIPVIHDFLNKERQAFGRLNELIAKFLSKDAANLVTFLEGMPATR